MFLSQRKYALDIINKVGLLASKPVSTPMEVNQKLMRDEKESQSPACKDPVRFRRIVGRLVHLTITRPDLSYAVHVLSQVMHKPREEQWDAVMKVIRYLKGSPGQGIMLQADSDLMIRAFCGRIGVDVLRLGGRYLHIWRCWGTRQWLGGPRSKIHCLIRLLNLSIGQCLMR